MALHFDKSEFEERQKSTLRLMGERGIDALLIFRQESMYYLTGYDTFGYVYFQCMILNSNGSIKLLTRLPDLHQATRTSCVTDIRVWVDKQDADPISELHEMLLADKLQGKRLGVEYEAYGLTGRNGLKIASTIGKTFDLVDVSELISSLRLIKSASELHYVRRAATLADDALDQARRLAVCGADEGVILAAMHSAIFSGGGDYPANEFIISSGEDALLTRYHSGRRALGASDQLTIEFAGVYRHYHACLMRTILIGTPANQHKDMFEIANDAMQACLETMRPGRLVGAVFDAYASTIDRAGMGEYRLNACGYSLGTTFSPNWMDWPMIYAGNTLEIRPGMVFFLHMILMDRRTNIAMMPGQTVVVTPSGCEVLSKRAIEWIVN